VDLGLRDRVVLITGAGGGVGPTLARAFSAEGAAVALQHRGGHGGDRAAETADGITSDGGRAITVEADLASEAETDEMVAAVADRLGPVGVLVTATSAYRMERFAEIEEESWSEVIDDLLGAAYRACRAVVPGMQEARWGRIVNFAARSGLVGTARSAHYAAAKAGIVGLTASLAKELGPAGILVNAVAPTQILTVKDGIPSIPEERVADLAKGIPARRVATPDDIAPVVLFLASDANRYVSGETISVTGGDQR
jgi:3-oxoacyl-[acyl-carrier protein] reductase